MYELSETIFRLIKLPDLVTLINALLGLSAILMMIRSPSDVNHASILILLAVMADGIDGLVARSMESGKLGESLDSLADVISFGVAPCVMVYAILAPQFHYFACFVGGAFLACGILRLARFSAVPVKKGFMGFPITTSGLVIVLYILAFYDESSPFFSIILLGIMFVMAMMMISNIPYPKIRDIRIIVSVAFLVMVIVLLFYLDYQAGLDIVAKACFLLMGLYVFSPIYHRT